MPPLLEIGLSNAGLAVVLAVVAAILSFFCRRPALVHSVWLLVVLKLLIPIGMPLPLPWSSASTSAEPQGVANVDLPRLDNLPGLSTETTDAEAIEPAPLPKSEELQALLASLESQERDRPAAEAV